MYYAILYEEKTRLNLPENQVALFFKVRIFSKLIILSYSFLFVHSNFTKCQSDPNSRMFYKDYLEITHYSYVTIYYMYNTVHLKISFPM